MRKEGGEVERTVGEMGAEGAVLVTEGLLGDLVSSSEDSSLMTRLGTRAAFLKGESCSV